MQNKWPTGQAIFDPSAIICMILVKAYQLKLHNKYQGPGPSSIKQEDF